MPIFDAIGSLRGPARLVPILLLLACQSRQRPVRVVLQPIEARGFLPARAEALQAMVATALPLLGPLNLRPETDRPDPPGVGAWRLRILAEAQGEQMRMGLRWSREGQPLQEQWLPWAPAHQTLTRWFNLLPFPVDQTPLARLLPGDTQDFFQALDLRVATRNREHWREAQIPSARRMAQGTPSLETALSHGRLHGGLMLEQGLQAMRHRMEAETAFRRCLEISPGHPEASAQFALVHTDLGQHGEALRLLREALRRHPFDTGLLRQLSYTARYAGLLDLSLRAVHRLEHLSGVPLVGIENSLLYQGHHQAFLEALDRQGDAVGWWPSHRFWKGYVALLEGDRPRALAQFALRRGTWGTSRFGQLGAVFDAIARQDWEEGRHHLSRLRASLASAGHPDGEFLLKVAEASCLLGDTFGALELLQRTSLQGFLCADWCRRSPFLAAIRAMPRYRLVLEHMDARREVLARIWTPAAFGLEQLP